MTRGRPIRIKKAVKYLSVFSDHELTGKALIDYVAEKTSHGAHNLARLMART